MDLTKITKEEVDSKYLLPFTDIIYRLIDENKILRAINSELQRRIVILESEINKSRKENGDNLNGE